MCSIQPGAVANQRAVSGGWSVQHLVDAVGLAWKTKFKRTEVQEADEAPLRKIRGSDR